MDQELTSRGKFALYFTIYLLLVLGGLADSLYLALSHYRVYTDIGYQSFCALSKSLNCDTVSQSPYAILLDIPVPLWGAMGYAFLLFMSFFARPSQDGKAPLWNLLLWVGILFSFYSLVLASISSFIIHSYCLMCILSYAINFSLAFWAWVMLKKFGVLPHLGGVKHDIQYLKHRRGPFLCIAFGFIVILLSVWSFLPRYWNISSEDNQNIVHLSGETDDGLPWIGAGQPLLTITEFTDYRCFQCKKMHAYLRRLLDQYPDKLRIVHRHFPMDHTVNPIVKEPYHNGSGLLALIAIAAGQQGRFWQMNDVIYKEVRAGQDISINAIATKAGFELEQLVDDVKSPSVFKKLVSDIQIGVELKIVGTPAYLIEGEVHQGTIPDSVIGRILD